jgi:competence protein ComGD
MVRLLQAKPAFSYLELIIVMLILSTMLYLQFNNKIQSSSFYSTDNQIKQLITEIQYLKSKAIKEEQSIVLIFRPHSNSIKIIDAQHNMYQPLLIKNGTIHPYTNLKYITFDKDGHNHQFGSLYVQFNHAMYKIIFHIEKGRIRYEKL